MQLNNIKPASGSKHSKKRVGRGIGSGLGKTSGRGHKGQKARAGGFHKVGFEGGQMPLQRRLPKRGFVSPLDGFKAEVRLGDLQKLEGDVIDLAALRNAGLVPQLAKRVKVILAGEIQRKVTLKGIAVTKGARAAVEAVGGTVEAPAEQAAPGKLQKKPAGAQSGGRPKKAAAGAESGGRPKNAAAGEGKQGTTANAEGGGQQNTSAPEGAAKAE